MIKLKEIVNESLQLPNGTEIQVGKVFTGQGKAFVKEEDLNKKKSPKREKLKTEAVDQELNIPFEMIGRDLCHVIRCIKIERSRSLLRVTRRL